MAICAGVSGRVPVGGFELSEQGGCLIGADGVAGGADAGDQRCPGEWELLAAEVGGDGVAEVEDVVEPVWCSGPGPAWTRSGVLGPDLVSIRDRSGPGEGWAGAAVGSDWLVCGG